MADRGFHVFSYLNADKAEAYRAVMRVFTEAKPRTINTSFRQDTYRVARLGTSPPAASDR